MPNKILKLKGNHRIENFPLPPNRERRCKGQDYPKKRKKINNLWQSQVFGLWDGFSLMAFRSPFAKAEWHCCGSLLLQFLCVTRSQASGHVIKVWARSRVNGKGCGGASLGWALPTPPARTLGPRGNGLLAAPHMGNPVCQPGRWHRGERVSQIKKWGHNFL